MNVAARSALFLVLILLCSVSAGAQTGVISGTITSPGGVAAGPGFSCGFVAGPVFPSGVAEGSAPYSAVREISHQQTLNDGTHISETTISEKIYRDAQGRTRTERPICRTEQGTQEPDALDIQIRDPVAGYAYVLDVQNHIAYRYVLRVRELPSRVALGTDKATVSTLASPAVGSPPAPPVGRITRNGEESLGTQTMEGVLVEGTRTTRTIPEGQVGNDRPLVTTYENWRAPDLKLTILTKISDPRSGERTIRLTNLDTTEPMPALFEPPADYKVVEETEPVRITYKKQ